MNLPVVLLVLKLAVDWTGPDVRSSGRLGTVPELDRTCAIVAKNVFTMETYLLYRKQIAATMRSRIPTMGRTTDRRNCNVYE